MKGSTSKFWQSANAMARAERKREEAEEKKREPKVVTKQELEQLGDWAKLTR